MAACQPPNAKVENKCGKKNALLDDSKAKRRNNSFLFSTNRSSSYSYMRFFLCAVKIIPEKISLAHQDTNLCLCMCAYAWETSSCLTLSHARRIHQFCVVKCKTEQTQWLRNVSTYTLPQPQLLGELHRTHAHKHQCGDDKNWKMNQ